MTSYHKEHSNTMPEPLRASSCVLDVSGLSKSYFRYNSELTRVLSWFFPISPASATTVLNNVSFSVAPGEAVGLVGQNGAGKSTLLKLITGTLKPTQGDVVVHGKVSAILELGMGFNGDLSGRQNAAHSAALMGYHDDEIQTAMADIEAFAEVGDYFDRPMRTYSSGMQMRVAFAVATAFRPDILIVDEALSVGDAYFQHKSFNRIREFQKKGTALLIVSHDKEAIIRLCDRVVLLDHGCVLEEGAPEPIMDYYNALIAQRKNDHLALNQVQVKALEGGKYQTSSGNHDAFVESVYIESKEGNVIEKVSVGESVTLVMNIIINRPVSQLVIGYMIKDRLGQTIFGTNTWHTQDVLCDLPVNSRVTFRADFDANLGPGNYAISTALHQDDTHISCNYHWMDYAYVFEIINFDKSVFIGSAYIMPSIDIRHSENESLS